MSNYTKTTDFEAKDSLPSGDSGKIIRGSEFETEFDNIATAIASKSDANNPTFTGTVTIDGLTVNGNTVLGNAATDTVTVTADIASNLLPSADDTYNLGAVGAEWNDLFIDGTANIDSLVAGSGSFTSISTTGDVTFGDNDKAIFGAGSDLQIYHDGNNSRIVDAGTGDLYLQANDQLRITNANATETMAIFNEDGAVSLRYNGSEKIATTSTGVDVTGTVVSDGLDLDIASSAGTDGIDFNRSGGTSSITGVGTYSQGIRVWLDKTDSSAYDSFEVVSKSTAVNRFSIDNDGDISFYEDTGTTAKFFWDASAESLGIGTSSPSDTLEVKASGNDDGIRLQGSGGANLAWLHQQSTDAATLRMYDGGSLNVLIGSNANANSYFNTGGNVGIGESAPDEALVVRGGNYAGNQDGGIALQLGDASGSHYKAAFKLKTTSGGVVRTAIDATNGTSGGTIEAISIANATGNVGIGTTSPSRKLHIKSGQAVAATIESTSTSTARLAFVDANTTDDTRVGIGSAGDDLQLLTANAERMRIDSSGNLLVGKTNTTLGTAGIENRADGRITSTRSGNTNLILNRLSSDGSLIDFYKDGTTVGSIGVTASDNLYIGGSSTDHTGLVFPDDAILPAKELAATDNFVDLGSSSRRFKDLYLSNAAKIGTSGRTVFGSGGFYDTAAQGNNVGVMTGGNQIFFSDGTGTATDNAKDLGATNRRIRDAYVGGGVYLGGTAAANKLDDYEEGTWTPVYAPSAGSFTTMTMEVIMARYTKVGDLVTVNCYIRTDDVDTTGASGSLDLSGLPFPSLSSVAANVGYASAFNTNAPAGGFASGTSIRLTRAESAGSTPSVSISDLTTGTTANRNELVLSCTYHTTA